MKTKELIRQLQEADPTGEEEVCVANEDIHFVSQEPAYYDGPLQVMIRDEDCKYYNIIGGKYKRNGDKIQIHTISFRDAILNNPDFPIDYSELSEERCVSTKKAHDDYRAWVIDMETGFEYDNFVNWATEKAKALTEDTIKVKHMTENFFKAHISRNDPCMEGGVPVGHSYISMRQAQWSEKFDVVMEDGFLKITVK